MSGFGMTKILDTETVLTSVEVGLTERGETLALLAQREVYVYLPSSVGGADLQYRVMLHEENIKAPVTAGNVLGMVTVTYEGKLLASVNLCAAEDVKESPFLAGLDRISRYTTGRRFLLICAYAVLLLLGYFVLLPYWRRRRNRKRAKFF
jgi:D-alanyl-D-alanine carboxypeptidase (penicillin-binding protein 5/6)